MKSRVAPPDPGAAGQRRVLAGAAVVAGRLDVTQPQPGRGAEVGRGVVVADEAVEDPALRRRPVRTPRPAPARRRRRRGCRSGRGRRPSRASASPVTSSWASSAAEPARAAASAASTSAVTCAWVVALPLTEPVATPSPVRTKLITVTREPVHHAVGGQGVVGPAQVGAGGVADDRDAVVGDRGRQRVLDERLRGPGVGGHRWPASSVVLRMRTSRNSAVGQPWLTAATCPGWALPQLKAPPRIQVSSPPTASMEFQKSVVVAW